MSKSSSPRRDTELLDQRRAVWDYLDALLSDIPDELPEDEFEAPAAPEVVEATPVEAPSEPERPAEVESVEQAEPKVDVQEARPELVPEPEPGVAPDSETGPPEWSRPSFQALLFEVGALRLAVPLVKLHSVVNLKDEEITPMPNQPDWYLGLMRYRDRNVRVVDTATMVLPAEKRDDAAESPPRHVLVVGDGAWGLACHGIGEVLKLGGEDVKWRTAKGKRPWLAGTVLGHLCALVDTEAFGDMPGGRGPENG